MNVTVLVQTVGLFLPIAAILPALIIGALRRKATT